MRTIFPTPMLFLLVLCALLAAPLAGAEDEPQLRPLKAEDLFELQYASDPRISPDGTQVAYVRAINDVMIDDTRGNIWLAAADGRDHRPLLSGTSSYSSPRWSPDGKRLAYIAGSARQLTTDDYDHSGPLAWTPDGQRIVFSANRSENWQYERTERDLYAVTVESGELEQLTDLPGIEHSPAVSPDGERIAFERDDHQGRQYSIASVALMDIDGSNPEIVTGELDRSAEGPRWAADGSGVYFHFDDRGRRNVGFATSAGDVRVVVEGLGGTTIGRPYISGEFSVAGDGTIAYTAGSAQRPADLFVKRGNRQPRRLTRLNENLLGHRDLAEVHEIVYESSVDGTKIQGWYLTPPGFDPDKTYPLILEIHGGPHLAYGPHFSAEMQRFAAEGYVVFYDNHRGSSSYGEEFGMKLEYKYSSESDFGDHMSGVDAMIEKGFVDPERLFIAGGSAGGIAAAYAIGLTDRFRAAAVAKPVINWISKTLTGDIYTSQIEHQFPGLPWEEFEHYWKRSPLSLVGKVSTPTLLITGEDDYRTPISETEQYYHAAHAGPGTAAVDRAVNTPGSGVIRRGYSMNASSIAVPRNEKKPATSVMVVRMIDDAVAGS
ncbi:MAG: prolyl oligopeptidase family serine peptidase [Xanthomonadaceae bacterium]|nr:prolyl oligopeptidase family serine peptidase [Xanthomonadaceae bacterium]